MREGGRAAILCLVVGAPDLGHNYGSRLRARMVSPKGRQGLFAVQRSMLRCYQRAKGSGLFAGAGGAGQSVEQKS